MAVALFTGGLGAFALAAMSRINSAGTIMYTDQFGGMDLFSEYLDATYRDRILYIAYLLTTDPSARQQLRQQIADADAKVEVTARELDAADLDRLDVATLERMTDAWHAYAAWRDSILNASQYADNPALAIQAYYAEGIKLTNALADASDRFRAQKRQVADMLEASNAGEYQQTRDLALGLSAAAVLLALAIGYTVSRSIVRPVRQVALAADSLADGELEQSVDVKSNDELGRMAAAFGRVVAYQQYMAAAAKAIASGDLSVDIQPKSERDVLGTAFHQMTSNLRDMVGELESKTTILAANAALLDLAHDAIIVRELGTARISFWSRGAEETYGWSRAEAIGATTHELLHTRFPSTAEDIDAELTRTGRWDGELIHTRKDGTILTVSSRQAIHHDPNNDRPLVLAINTDISDRIAAETELARARDAAQAASAAKNLFLANTSHEIRTPMNAILGMAELLAETPLNEEQREYVRTFQRAGDTLLTLIDDVLDLSKAEAGQLNIEQVPFDLSDLVDHVAEVLAVRAHAKGLELNVQLSPEVPTYVVSDPTRLRQVMVNLVGNAIKFTDSGEVTLRIAADGSSAEGDRVRFSVRDTGIGIAANKQQEIFADFVQADASTTRRHGGTGLGLAISRRIVELMGGALQVVSQPGLGSIFSFTIPMPAASPDQSQLSAPAVDLTGWRVLVADDNATNRLILRQFLTTLGASVVEVSDGVEALEAMRMAREGAQPFRLLLLDGRMPQMGGFEVASALRGDTGMLSETVVMLTSDSRAGDVARARELGLRAYLVKPVKRLELLRLISAVAEATSPGHVEVAPRPRAVPTPTVSTDRPLKLLLVDDSADNRMLIQAYLKKLPYHVDVAQDGLEGLTKIRENDYDLVLMDMLMPVMDGLEATRALRAWERGQGRHRTPVIALTANAMEEDVRRCLEAGCDAHVAKPVKKAALLDSITQYASAA